MKRLQVSLLLVPPEGSGWMHGSAPRLGGLVEKWHLLGCLRVSNDSRQCMFYLFAYESYAMATQAIEDET